MGGQVIHGSCAGQSGAQTGRRAFCLLPAVLLCLGLAHALPGQATPLAPPNARLSEGFTAITSVRELKDGRVLFTDPRERRIGLVDFKTNQVTSVGRKGNGPGEFVNVAPLHALARDSSIMVDAFSRRWLLFAADRIVATVPPDESILPSRSFVVGIDTLGGLAVAVTSVLGSGGLAGTIDSSEIVRLTRRGSTTEHQGWMFAGKIPDNPKAMRAWPVYDRAFHTKDGWTALIRIDPYRVDWVPPSGAVKLGKPFNVPSVPVTSREKLAFMELRGRLGGPEGIPDWPSHVPAIDVTYPIVEAPSGELLIPRVQSADIAARRYDVVDRQGRLVRQIVLPMRGYLIGSGKKSLYSVALDQDDLNFLQRHPWP